MSSFFDKLNLRPGERRLVVIVGIVVFIILNVWFVWPNFGAYAATKEKIKKSETNLKRFTMEAGRKGEYEKLLKNLETQGVFVGQEDQALQLQRDVGSQAALSGVSVLRYDPSPRAASGRTNSFFDEASLIISLSTGEKELIDFLYNVGGARNSLIRVKSMTLNPELPARMKLMGSLTLVESFQKKPPAPRPVSAPAPAPSSKPALTNKPAATAKPVVAPDKSAGKTNQLRKAGPAGK